MKTKASIALFVLIALSFTAWQFTNKGLKEQLSQHLKNGDTEALATYFQTDVGITVEGKEYFEKENATAALADFFEAYPPIDFKLMHYGESKSKTSSYLIGELTTDSKKFRIVIDLYKEAIESIIISDPVYLG